MSRFIELYDIGRTTHRKVTGRYGTEEIDMYELIVCYIDRYVSNPDLAEKLREEARNRERPGHSIAQEHFSRMCAVWTEAYKHGDFQFDPSTLVYPDTVPRFQKVHAQNRDIGILTSASEEFTRILFNVPFPSGGCLSDLVTRYFLGEEIGDKDFPETFVELWERTEGRIYAVFDDKPSVCKAASDGIKLARGSARIYLVDRKNQYSGEVLDELADKGVIKVSSFDKVND